MPFAAKPMLDEDLEKQKQQQGGVNISGTSTSFSTGIPGQDSTKSKTSSGNYANIQSYLDANKEQADGMGQKIASDVDQSAGAAQTKIAGLESKAPKVDAYDPNEVFNNVTKLTDEQKNAYRTQKSTGGYSGPQSIDQVEGYADTQKAASDANNKLKSAGTETGQQQLLKDTYARPKYTAGENRLDQALLQNSDGSKQSLEAVRSKYSDLDDLFSTSAVKVGDSINQANAQSLKNKQNVLSAEEQQWNSLLNPLQQRATQANIDNPKMIKSVQDDLSDDILSADTLKRLGLTAGQKLYDQNISSYLNPNYTQVGIDNVATADERAKYKALADLVQDPTRTQLTDAGASVSPIGFDIAKFNSDNAAKAAELSRIFSQTNFTGSGGFENDGDYFSGTSSANVADYLARGADALSYGYSGFGVPRGGTIGGQLGEDLRSTARNNFLQQLNDFLNQHKYNRTIQKG